MTTAIVDQLARIVGRDSVFLGASLENCAIDGVVPYAVAFASDRAQVGEVLRWASAEGATVFPTGGGTKQCLGNRPDQVDVVLDLRQLDRVLDYQPADMTVTVEAGITLAELQQELATAGQFVPLEAAFPEMATIGGILATASTGPLAHSYGPPRDWLIGIGVTGADGVATKAGGKVVKNVTGYDLNKLYTGSLGTLGIVVEATFKVSPLQPQSTALTACFPTLDSAVAAGTALLDSPAAPLAYIAILPDEAGRSPHRSADPAYPVEGVAFYSGRPNATRRRMDETADALERAGATSVSRLDGPQASAIRHRLTNQGWEPKSPPALAVKISVPRRSVRSLVAACSELGDTMLVADPGFGTLRLFWSEDPGDGALLGYIQAAREAARSHGGKAVVERCPPSVKTEIDVWDLEPDSMVIMRRIKEQFDPAGILNPGRFLGHL